MKTAIIGAGPAGMTTAYLLSKNNHKVDVYEASDKIGGLSATISLWNQKVDLGPHRFFSSDPQVNKLWLEVVEDNYEMVDRLTRIYYKDKFYNYPLKPFNALKNLGLFEASLCLFSYLYQIVLNKKDENSFESWVQNRFGKRLYKIFFKTYTEKLWGIECDKLDSDFAAQRIKKLSLFEAVKNAFLSGSGNKHRTLIDQFAYPKEGSGYVYEKMAELVKEHQNNVFINTPVYRIITKNNKATAIELMDGTIKEYDNIVTTMPYTTMIQRLPEVPENIKTLAKSLKYRNTILVYLLIDKINLFPDNWLYIHSAELQMGRITNFRNWLPTLYGDENKTIIAIEYWANDDELLWNTKDDELINLAKKEIVATKLVEHKDIKDGYIYKIPKSYPVYNRGYKESLAQLEEYSAAIEGLHVIGRNGSFKYNNQDHSILMGIMAAENIMHNANHDLTTINSDYETYQEAHIITKTGLVKQE